MRERPLLALAIGAVAGILIHRAGLPAAAATGLALPVLAGAIVLWRRGRTIDAGILLTALLVAGIAGGRAELLNARRARLAAAWSAWEGGRARLRLVEPPLLLQPPPGAPRADRLAFDAVLLPAPPGEPPDLPATATPPQEASRRAQSANPPQPAPQTDTASGEDAPQADEESAVGPPDPLAGARVRLYVDTDEADDPAHWRPGQVVSAVVRPGRLRPSATPGAFSVADYHARERLVGSGGAAAVRPQGPADSGGPGALLFDLRRVLVRAVFAAYNAPASNVLAAVLLGYREGVSPELRTPFRRTGTGHLLAVSGLHVGLVTGLAWFLARRLRAGPRGAALAGIAVCLLYLGLTGGRPSAVRAGVMAILYLGGFLVARRSDLLNALAAAALGILLVRPATIADAGFLLSFTAVLFLSRLGRELHAFDPWTEERGGAEDTHGPGAARLRRLGARTWGLFLLAVAAWVGLWPLSATYFHLLSFGSLVLNVIVIPWLSVVLVAGLVGLPAAWAPAWATPWAAVAQTPMDLLLGLTDHAAALPWLAWPVHPPAGWAMGLYYGAFALLFARTALPEAWRARARVATAGLLGCAVVGLFVTMRPAPAPPADRVTVLPAGPGECAVVELADGRAAVVGHLPRGGMDAVDYLRGAHRARLVTVVRVPHPFDDDQPPPRLLREQYGADANGFAERTLPRRRPDAAEGAADNAWTGGPLPGMREVELIPVWHRWNGVLAGWVLRVGDLAVLCGEYEYARALVWSAEALDLPPLDLAVLHLRDRSWPDNLRLAEGALRLARADYSPRVRCTGPVLAGVRLGMEPPAPFADRDRVGAIRLTGGSVVVRVYDGADWQALAPESAQSGAHD